MSADASFTSVAKRRTRKVPLTVAIAGAVGTGKSALVDALAGRRLARTDSTVVNAPGPSEPDESGSNGRTGFRITQHPLEDDAEFIPVVLDVQSSGSLDAEDDIEALTQYLETRFDEMVSEQSRIRRNPRFEDRRVHACIYLVHAPHGLAELDVVSMTRLSTLTTVIPVISGAEALTPEELREMKVKVRQDCKHYKIPIFEFEDIEGPLHITRTNEYDSQGNALLSLRLPYGRVDATDPAISDFNALRVAVFRTYALDIIDHTVDILYEQYRTIRLSDPTARYSVLEPEALAGHATRLKQEMLERESRELKDQEDRINRELEQRRQEILERENELRRIEKQLEEERLARQSALETHKLAQRNALLEAERNNSTSFHETDPLEEVDEDDPLPSPQIPRDSRDRPASPASSLSVKSAKSALSIPAAAPPPPPVDAAEPAPAPHAAPIAAPVVAPPAAPSTAHGAAHGATNGTPNGTASAPPVPGTAKTGPILSGTAKTGPVLTGTAKTGPAISGTAKTGPILSGTAKTGPLGIKTAPGTATSPLPGRQAAKFDTEQGQSNFHHTDDQLQPPPKMTLSGSAGSSGSGSAPGSPKLGRKISLSSLSAAASAAASSVTSRLKTKHTAPGSPYVTQLEYTDAPPSPQVSGAGTPNQTEQADLPSRSFVSLPIARSSSSNNSPQIPDAAGTPPTRPSMSDKRPPSFVATDGNSPFEGLVSRNSFTRKPSNARDSPTVPYDAKFSQSGSSLGSETARPSPSLPPRSPNRPSSFVSLDGTLSRTRSIPDRMGATPATNSKSPYSPVVSSLRQMPQ